jgi:hypothetical protein
MITLYTMEPGTVTGGEDAGTTDGGTTGDPAGGDQGISGGSILGRS